jgi:hypothetical protein
MAMKNKNTYYQIILDRSGSMSDCLSETISGFNEQLQMIQDLQRRFPEQHFYVSLTIFNHLISHTMSCCSSDQLKPLTLETYVPDGSTALLDAIGESVMSLKTKIEPQLENDEATAVAVILTDGHENASRIFDWHAIRRMITELEASGNWTFSFLGAKRDALETASNLNIRQQNAASFEKMQLRNTIHNVSESLMDYAFKKRKGEKPNDFLKK